MDDARMSRARKSPLRPGQVFWLPRGASWLNRDKPRPFVLAAGPPMLQAATLAYASTREAEKSLGAPCIQVTPQRDGVNRNGLWSSTHVYPGILLRTAREVLPQPAGTLGKSTENFKACLRRALGIDQGSCFCHDAPGGSRRGRIVELQPALSSELQTRFAVLLTEAGYSRRRNYQIILPIVPGDGKAPAESILQIRGRAWMSVFDKRPQSVLLPIPVIQSVWYGTSIVRETEFVMDRSTLAEIDRRLCEFFELAPARASGELPGNRSE
jgi:hypothetical protein